MKRNALHLLAVLAAAWLSGCATVNKLSGSPVPMSSAMPPMASEKMAYTPDPNILQPAAMESMSGPTYDGGSIYMAGNSTPLFEDRRARRVGDILTINLVERTLAQKSATTSTTKDSDIAFETPATLLGQKTTKGGIPLFNAELDASRGFSGSGASSQSNKLEGTVSVTVSKVFANGSMFIQGEKSMWINQGEERVQITGVVRPEDIDPDNSVPSSRVADVRIVYAGQGALADANAQGWLSRFFNSPLWPF